MEIARRILTLGTADGDRNVAISIDAPLAAPDGAWFCRYTIDCRTGCGAAKDGAPTPCRRFD